MYAAVFGGLARGAYAAPLDGPLKLGADRVTMDDSLFELLLVPSPRSAADLQGLVMALLDQRYDGMVFRRTPSLRLETGEELPWFLDGEAVSGALEVEIVNSRRALTMLL